MMKLTRCLLDATASGATASVSFEFFAPLADGVEPLRRRITALARAEPLFVTVVGVGSVGSARTALTLALHAKQQQLTACVHVAAADFSRDEACALLDDAKAAGVRNVIFESGVHPSSRAGGAVDVDTPRLSSARELAELARKVGGDFFCIGVLGFPRGCVTELGSFEADVSALASGVLAGCVDFVVAAPAFDAVAITNFVAAVAGAGALVPVIPSVPVAGSLAAYEALVAAAGVHAAPADERYLHKAAAADRTGAAFSASAATLAARLARDLLSSGATSVVHFVTLNQEWTLRSVLVDLGLGGGSSGGGGTRRRLPWRVAPDEARATEDVRPIFWGNRAASYVARTARWTKYPTGRWFEGGSQRQRTTEGGGSGAELEGPCTSTELPESLGGASDWGELDHDLYPAGSVEERRALWGIAPKDERAVWAVFVAYITGTVSRLPWCDSGGLAPETDALSSTLARLNAAGFLTINSQPCVNGAPSESSIFGWGGIGGYVYQKAYIECFCPPGHLAALMDAAASAASFSSITWHAVNSTGSWHATNARGASRGGVNAVTWGVFPDREVIQPTVMAPAAFVGAWREEAFALWLSHWASIYEEDSDSHGLICDMHDNYYLVNAVDNNFNNEATDSLQALFNRALQVLEVRGTRDPQTVSAALDQQRAARLATMRVR
jgi:methylenetetrahydrofolate reductase (NADPH)